MCPFKESEKVHDEDFVLELLNNTSYEIDELESDDEDAESEPRNVHKSSFPYPSEDYNAFSVDKVCHPAGVVL